jgi:hypothetical protein
MSLRTFLPLSLLLAACGLRVIDHRPPEAVTPGPEAGPVEVETPDAATAVDAAPQPPRPDAAAPSDGPRPPAPDATAVTDPPGAGVMINGRFVPRSKAVVFLHLGHSNMAGRATTPADLMPYFYDLDPQLFTYAKGGLFRPAKEPTAPDNEAGQAAGPGMALLHAAQAVAPPDAVIISIGHGQSGSFQGYCSSFRKNGLFYDLVMTPAKELRGKVTFGGIFTMFGQSEHNAPPAEQAVFAQCLAGLAGEMRADLGEPNLPFMVGDYEMGISRADIAPNSAFARPIIAQLQKVPGLVSTAAVIPTLGCPMQDDHHFNMAGHKMWAGSAIQLLLDHHWAPWAAAP